MRTTHENDICLVYVLCQTKIATLTDYRAEVRSMVICAAFISKAHRFDFTMKGIARHSFIILRKNKVNGKQTEVNYKANVREHRFQ